MKTVRFGTKAVTLDRLHGRIKTAHVLPQVRFSALAWKKNPESILKAIEKEEWHARPMIVRSSGSDEDGRRVSRAGEFVSVLGVVGRQPLSDAIAKVVGSFSRLHQKDEVFVQPQIQDVALSGVAFSRDQNTGAPYIIINYDDESASTNSVTSGSTNALKIFITARCEVRNCPSLLKPVLSLIAELEKKLGSDALDIEFAATKKGRLYLLQVRPLTVLHEKPAKQKPGHQKEILNGIAKKVAEISHRHPYLYGQRSILGIMPDWNPAEITGIRPRPLTLSLYKELVTDSIWAYQRDRYGYKNLRSFPLLVHFWGSPYIDVRVSFNSFLPADLGHSLSERLVDYYLDCLSANPALHDKVEFEIVYSCYTLDIEARLRSLREAGFSSEDCQELMARLKRLTAQIIDPNNGIWKGDLEKLAELERRRKSILESSLDDVSRVYWLLEDCKRFGTLPFAGLARAAFIAVQNLRSLLSMGLLSADDYQQFMRSLHTVSSQLSLDLGRLTPENFLSLYGHLRPGTYDILAPRYDEDMSQYFGNPGEAPPERRKTEGFQLSPDKRRAIDAHLSQSGLGLNADQLFDFMRRAIESREYGKFVFTRSLSDALSLLKKIAKRNGWSSDEISYVDIKMIEKLYSSSSDERRTLSASIQEGKEMHAVTQSLILPALIKSPDDVYSFLLLPGKPNFITSSRVRGPVTTVEEDRKKLKGSILFIPSADPGFDWIFSWKIAGFVTLYGGANSHMAIRAAEQGVAAVIGAGEALYQKWKSAKELDLDCGNQQVRILR